MSATVPTITLSSLYTPPTLPPFSLTPENAEVLTEISVLYLKINETQKAYDRLAEVVNIERKCTPKGLLALGAILQVSRHTPPLPLRLLSPFH